MLARFIVYALVTCGWLAAAAMVAAQQPRPYDGIQAGLDAYRLGEERRQAAASQQLFHNDQLKLWAGIPTGRTIYYGYPALPMSLDYAYAYGPPVIGGYRPGLVRAPLTVFEPWPFVPGDIYGYSYYLPLRQPIGQWQGQTGERRWESHPVYEPPPAEKPAPAAAPREASPPPLPALPPPAPPRTPREF